MTNSAVELANKEGREITARFLNQQTPNIGIVEELTKALFQRAVPSDLVEPLADRLLDHAEDASILPRLRTAALHNLHLLTHGAPDIANPTRFERLAKLSESADTTLNLAAARPLETMAQAFPNDAKPTRGETAYARLHLPVPEVN